MENSAVVASMGTASKSSHGVLVNAIHASIPPTEAAPAKYNTVQNRSR